MKFRGWVSIQWVCRSKSADDRPAPAGTGIVFRRTDLEFFGIPASWKNVARVSYATSLMRQGVLIQTTEHLLSTLYSFAIDNVYIEIDNLEVPILDGSGKPFVDLLRAVGDQFCDAGESTLAHPPPGDRRKTARKRISILPDNGPFASPVKSISPVRSENSPSKWR